MAQPGSAHTKKDPQRVVLLVAGICALLLHAGAAFSIGLIPSARAAVREPHEPSDAPKFETKIPYVTLGEREGAPLSLSWIAMDEPETHAAMDPSEVVQPRLRTEEAAPVKGPETGRVGPGEAAQAVDMVAIKRLAAQAERARRDAIEQATRRVRAIFATPARVLDLLARLEPTEDEERETESGVAQQEQPDVQPQTPGGGAPDPAPQATVTDREAEASSTIEALADLIGSDVTSEGLTIRTFRPIHSPYVQIMANPGPAIFDIEFNDEGKAFALLVQSSGDRTVDNDYKNIISQKWRGSGAAIERLKETPADDRVLVRLKILF